MLTITEIMCEEIIQKESVQISLNTTGINPDERFNEDVEIAAYRFIKEGITNAIKHSGTDKLEIHLELHDSKIQLAVRDLGKGFDTGKIEEWALTSDHFGIIAMKERIEGLGGELSIISAEGQGTTLKATIPVR